MPSRSTFHGFFNDVEGPFPNFNDPSYKRPEICLTESPDEMRNLKDCFK